MSFFKSPMMVSMLTLFLILVGATIYRIFTAIESDPGLVVADAYMSGESYAQTLENKRQLSAQGWTLDLLVPVPAVHNQQQTYQAISAKNSRRYTKAKATAYFYRPLEKQHDFSIPMVANTQNAYQVDVALPLKGRWDLVVEITKGDFLQRAAARLFAQ